MPVHRATMPQISAVLKDALERYCGESAKRAEDLRAGMEAWDAWIGDAHRFLDDNGVPPAAEDYPLPGRVAFRRRIKWLVEDRHENAAMKLLDNFGVEREQQGRGLLSLKERVGVLMDRHAEVQRAAREVRADSECLRQDIAAAWQRARTSGYYPAAMLGADGTLGPIWETFERMRASADVRMKLIEEARRVLIDAGVPNEGSVGDQCRRLVESQRMVVVERDKAWGELIDAWRVVGAHVGPMKYGTSLATGVEELACKVKAESVKFDRAAAACIVAGAFAGRSLLTRSDPDSYVVDIVDQLAQCVAKEQAAETGR